MAVIYGVSQDITELRLAEEKLKASESHFRALIENSSDGVAVFGADGSLAYIAPTVKDILGYTDAEMMQMDLSAIIHPDAFAARAQLMEKVLANPEIPVKGFIKQMRHKDGRWLWIESTMTNMLGNPAVGAFVDNFRDITEQKRAQDEILHTSRLYNFISELNHTIVHSANEKSLFRDACRIAVELGEFKTAWIGLTSTCENRFRLEEHYGLSSEAVERLLDVNYHDEGPVGIAVKTGEYCVCDFETQPGLKGWKKFASDQSWRSYMVIPIRKNSQTSWPIRWASPSTPTSFRMMSWMDLTVVLRDMGFLA